MIDELKSHLNTVASGIGTRIDSLDRRLIEVEKSGKRIFHGGPRDGDGEEARAMKTWARSGVVEKALSVGADGQSVTVRGDWSDRIFELIRESSPLRQVANVQQTGSDALEVLVDRGEPVSEWAAETATRAVTDASFLTRHRIAAHEHFALPETTLMLLEDSQFNVENWLQQKIAERFARAESTAFFLGNGTNQPRGLLDYALIPDNLFAWGADPDQYEIGAIYSGVAGEVGDANSQLDSLYRTVDALKADYLSGAVWLMPRAFRSKIRLEKDGDGRSLFQPSLDAAIPDRLLGFPVILCEDMDAPADGTVGAFFGNFREAFTIVDRLGISVQRDTITRPGFVRWYARRRVGGALTNPEACKALVLATDPVVTT
jgi:HK97 family phage major capsid protein